VPLTAPVGWIEGAPIFTALSGTLDPGRQTKAVVSSVAHALLTPCSGVNSACDLIASLTDSRLEPPVACAQLGVFISCFTVQYV
jgi:hypothetical protein